MLSTAIFSFGRKQGRVPQLAAGLLLMVYPYFIGNVVWMLVVGAVLVVGLWLVVRAGY